MRAVNLRNGITLLVLLFVVGSTAQAADVNFPYGRINLKLPPIEDPYPGLGSYYSAYSCGLKSVLWNPASLGKVKLTEASISIFSPADAYSYNKISKVEEKRGTFEVGAGSGISGKATMDYALFFRPYNAVTGIGLATKEVEIQSNLNYSTSGTGINFSAAQRMNDWLIVGFTSNNPIDADIALAGNFPVTGRVGLNLYGKSMGNMAVATDGKLKYTITSGGITTTPETTTAAWGGFLTQEVTIPLTGVSELRDSLNIQSPYTGTIATQYKKFYAGLNFIPISANAEINNDVRTVVNSDVPDQLFYVPNFNPDDPSSGTSWLADPDKYGTSAGYSRKQIILPAGDVVANAKYRGFYSGNTTRMDLGFMYDISDMFTVGMALENINGATLTMKGNGLSAYYDHRDFSTSEVDTLLQPGQNSSWTPITDSWITSFEAGDKVLSLDPEKVYPLPKKFRLGAAVKFPFLITIDYEQNQTPITIRPSDEASKITVSNLNFLRLGMESSLFRLPLIFRLGTTVMFKPTVTGGDQKTQDSIDKAFKFMVLPLKMDFGSTIDLWGYKYEDSIGFNALSIINLLQVDTNNIDLSKMLYYSMAVEKDVWQIKYLYQVDPGSTAAAYGTKSPGSDGKKTFDFGDVKFMQTLGVTYKF